MSCKKRNITIAVDKNISLRRDVDKWKLFGSFDLLENGLPSKKISHQGQFSPGLKHTGTKSQE